LNEEEKEQERTIAAGRRLDNSRVNFSEVQGICRTCANALIRRRQYSEVPQVICQATFEQPHRVPLDVTECTDYKKVGEMHIRDMNDIALIIDPRKKGGQYL
jgi:hypothetical protein